MQKIIVWKNSTINTTEFVSIEKEEMTTVKGYITGEGFGKPWLVRYTLTLNPRWEAQTVIIEVMSEQNYTIELYKNDLQQWLNEKGEHLKAFDGCVDVDISFTPFTNSLPINRLQLTKGEGQNISVVWVDIKNGDVKRVKQRYLNKGSKIYKYENEHSGYISELIVDDEGYVVDYPGVWQKIY
ncbi:putative glycolipid-binding domain-containing protein [Chitinophaga sancti]|uniref:putative glycolipid-binding domain-containing protein n=1 Tax=Chitinophaga sancti TaxID=1004 RepID=UPI002A756557|nr:putative glycolipid-binding domain-containing protein [Chitinophaga sancti]WPQ62357.1 putative glycolipid-binding domain-containing protein [Chitinophaga sancti]